MGGQIEQWLSDTSKKKDQSPTATNSVSSWLSGTDSSKLRMASQFSDPTKPEQAARLLRLHEQSGIPLDIIAQNPDSIELELKRRIDPDTLIRQSPHLSNWLSENPEHVSAAGDDIPRLSTVEQMLRALRHGSRVGWAQSEEGAIGFQAMEQGGELDEISRKRLQELASEIERTERGAPIGRSFLSVLYEGAKIYGQMANAIPRAIQSGITGASAGAAASVAALPFGPVAAPVALGAVTGGFLVGATYGFSDFAFKQEGGHAYLELSRIKGEDGQQLDEDTKRNAALAVGAVNALLETTGVSFIAAPFRSAAKSFMRNAVDDALYRPTMRAALADFGKAYATAIAGETGTEVLQELTNVVAEELAMNADKLESPEERESLMTRLASIAEQTAKGMLLVGVPGAITSGTATAINARRAQRREALFTALGEQLAESPTYQKLPSAVQKIVEKATKNGPIENVYVPVEVWTTYWQSQKVDPADMAERVTGTRSAWDEAQTSGGDIVIPTSRYAVTLAPTEHNAFFAKELRTSPMAMSSREAQEFMSTAQEEAEQELTPEEAQRQQENEQIVGRMKEQLQATGYDEQTAGTYAQLFRQVFALDPNASPEQVFQKFNLTVTRNDDAQTEETADSEVLNQSQIVNQYMAWKAVLDDPEIAQPLRDIAWMKVRDLEPHARAEQQTEIDAANAEYERKTGMKWMGQSGRNLKAPPEAVAELRQYEAKLKEMSKEPGVNEIEFRAEARAVALLTMMAEKGTFDDVNVFLAQLNSAFMRDILRSSPTFSTWFDDMQREPPTLTLMQSSKFGEIDEIGPAFWKAWAEKKDDLEEKDLMAWQSWVQGPASEYGYAKGTRRESLLPIAQAEFAKLPLMVRELVLEVAPEVYRKYMPLDPRIKFLGGFQSRAEQIIATKMPNKASIEDIRNLLKDIKADERKWLNLDTFLKDQEHVFGMTALTKQEMLEFLHSNRLVVRELKQTTADKLDEDLINDSIDEKVGDAAREVFDAEWDVIVSGLGGFIVRDGNGAFVTARRYNPSEMQLYSDDPEDAQVFRTRSQAKEAALSYIAADIRANESMMADFREEAEYEAGQDAEAGGFEEYTLKGGENYREYLFIIPVGHKGIEEYRGPHWDDSNVFAHMRVKDRVTPDGKKVFFIEEIQSDWHQAGRDKGYRDVTELGRLRAILVDQLKNVDNWGDDDIEEFFDSKWDMSMPIGDFAKQYSQESFQALVDYRNEKDGLRSDAVPNAPFKKTWHEFVMKRAIRLAAEMGYDAIGWTTGLQQNQRYNLEKFVDRIVWEPIENSTRGVLSAYKEDTRKVNEPIDVKQLPEYVGKEVADKLLAQTPSTKRFKGDIAQEIDNLLGEEAGVMQTFNSYYNIHDEPLAQAIDKTVQHARTWLFFQVNEENAKPWMRNGDPTQTMTKRLTVLLTEWAEGSDFHVGSQVLAGEELAVGGRGMRGFYDEMLVSFTQGFIKKYGGKVGPMQTKTNTATMEEINSGAVSSLDHEETITTKEVTVTREIMVHNVHGFALTDAMKQAALKDEFTLYQLDKQRDTMTKAERHELYTDALAEIGAELAEVAAAEELGAEELEGVDSQLAYMFTTLRKMYGLLEARDSGEAYAFLSALPAEDQQWFFTKFPKAAAWVLSNQQFSQDGGARGRIKIKKGQVNIELLKNADLSTFIHETGHMFLEILHDLRDSSPEIRKHYDVVRNWMGAPGDAPFTREQHELWARGFERYLMEGRAPVPALRRAFVRFKVWLLSVYNSLADLNVELTDEVRNVFDRLLASQQELDAVHAQQSMMPLFSDPEVLSEADAKEYQEAVEAAQNAASEEMVADIMKDWRREQRRVFQREREKVQEQAAQEADEDPVMRARALLTRGTLPSGGALPEGEQPFKLSKDAILAEHGEKVLRALPTPLVWTVNKDTGLHPDMAADLLGFKSGAELVQALLVSKDPREWIQQRTNEVMRQRKYQMSPLKEGEVPVEAQKAVHNEKRAQLLRRELELLATDRPGTFKKLARTIARRVPLLKDVREEAEALIAKKVVRSVRPHLYLKAEQKAHKAAMEAFLKGDIQLAFQQKQKELINHELYRAAVRAIEEAERIASYAQRFEEKRVRERLGKAGASYLEQIDGFRDRFEFAKVSFKDLDKRQSLREFLAEHEEMGFTPSVPDYLISEALRRNYKELTFEELRDVHLSMQQIERLARTKNRLLASARAREFSVAKGEIIDAVKANHTLKNEELDLAPDLKKRMAEGVRGFMAAHNKAEFIFEFLDGYKEMGVVWTYFFKPFVDAENTENKMMHAAVRRAHDIFAAYTRAERSTWLWKKHNTVLGQLTKSNIISMALNWGNAYNRDALVRGYAKFGWSEEKVVSVLNDHMDERDWQTVQAIWDWIDEYWPAAERLERDINGLPPGKVEALPVHTKFGTMRGGYYPIVFDRRLSWRQAVLDLKEQVKDMFGGQFAYAMTKRGHLKERTNTGGKPIRLELTGLTDHVTNVIHDLTHRRAVMDVNRLIEDPDIREIMERAIGKDLYRQLRPWLMNIARPQYRDFVNPIEGIMSRARMGATVVNLGWKMTTSLVQFLGFTGSVNEIGPVYASKGLAHVFGRPHRFADTWRFVTSRSEFMRHRIENYDRDVNDALKGLQVSGTAGGPMSAALAPFTQPMRDSFFQLIGLMDMGVSLPTWVGAYQKALDGKVPDVAKGNEPAAIDYADKVVRQTQGVGTAKDLATVQRGPETVKIFTMFYTYFAGLYNQFAKSTRRVERDKNVGRFIASMAMLWWVPAAMGELLLGRGPDADDDEDEWIKWFLGVELSYPFQSIVLVRDVVNGMRFHSYEPSAAFDMFAAMRDAGQMVAQQVGDAAGLTGETEVTRYQIQQTVQAIGYVTQLPSRQLWLTGEYFYDWWTGEEEPASPAEGLFRSLVTGKPRED